MLNSSQLEHKECQQAHCNLTVAISSLLL